MSQSGASTRNSIKTYANGLHSLWKKFLSAFIPLSGPMTILIASPVLMGSLDPSFHKTWALWVPMQFNTAMTFTFLSISWMSLQYGHILTSRLFGTAGLLIAFLTMIQGIPGFNFGLDQLFRHAHSIGYQTPGRMAPITAIGFISYALSLLLHSLPNLHSRSLFISGQLGVFCLALGIFRMTSYFLNLSGSFDPGSLYYMALPTAFGLGCLGGALSLLTYQKLELSRVFLLRPFRLSALFILLALALWQTLLSFQVNQIKNLIAGDTEKIKIQISNRLQFTAEAIQRFATRLEYFGVENRKYLTLDANSYLRDLSILRRVAVVDPHYQVIQSFPQETNPGNTRLNYTNDEKAKKAFVAAAANHGPFLSSVLTLQSGEVGFILASPIFKKGRIAAFLYGLIASERLFSKTVDPKMFSISVRDENFEIFNQTSERAIAPLANTTHLFFEGLKEGPTGDLRLEITLIPTAKYVSENSTSVPYLILLSSLLLAIVTSYFLFKTAHHRESESLQHSKIKAALDRLKETENLNSLYKIALDKAAIVAFTDVKGKISYVNRKFCEISEYSEEELLGKDHRIVNSGRMGKEFFKSMWETISNGDSWHGEICNRSKSGNFYWVDTIIIPILDSSGKIDQYVAIRNEITERKRLEAELENSNAIQRAILSSANFSIISTNIQGTILTFNKRAEDWLGYKASELVGKQTPALIHLSEEVVARAEELSQELGFKIIPGFDSFVAKTTATRLADENEWTYLRKDGSRFPVRLSVTALVNAENQVIGYLGIAEDISERKNSETALREGRNRLKALLELASDGVHILDKNGNIVEFSESFARMLGYSLEEAARLNVADWDALIPKEAIMPTLQKLLYGGATFETKHRSKEGRVFDVEINAKGIEIGGERFLYASSRDITERKATANELETSKNRLQLAADVAGIGVWIWDLTTQSLEWDSKMLEIYQVPEAVKRSRLFYDFWKSVTYPEDFGLVETALKEALAAQTRFQKTFRINHPDGSTHYIESAANIEKNTEGQPIKLLGINRDITGEKTATENLNRSERRLKSALEGSSDGIWDWDLVKNEVYFSEKLAELFGTSQTVAVDTPGVFEKFVDSDDLKKSFESVEAHLRGETPLHEYEWRLKTPDGKTLWMLARGKISERDAQGKPIRITGVHINIQELKDAQEQLRTAEETARLASRAKSDFLSTMSHEIRTPLNCVIGMSDLMLESKLDAEQVELAQGISTSGKVLLTVINSILDFSKIEAGKMTLELIEFDLTSFLTELLRPYTYTAEQKGITFQVQIQKLETPVWGDSGRIGQIVNNLVSNALKFTKKGGVRVEMTAAKIGDQYDVTLLVKDTGIGIPEEAKNKMFQAFSQAEQSTTRNFGGTGLGLSISKRLVDLMAGQISFESLYGEGTTFTVKIQLKTKK